MVPELPYTRAQSRAALSLGGASLGVVTAALARLRGLRRKTFIASVEAGKVAAYRIEPTPEGKVLMRVATTTASERVADVEKEVYELDDRGDAKNWVDEDAEAPAMIARRPEGLRRG